MLKPVLRRVLGLGCLLAIPIALFCVQAMDPSGNAETSLDAGQSSSAAHAHQREQALLNLQSGPSDLRTLQTSAVLVVMRSGVLRPGAGALTRTAERRLRQTGWNQAASGRAPPQPA